MRQLETVIIGGGIAGLACARQLQRAGRDFLLISDRLGGRLHATADGLNFGAAYITTDYKHVAPFVDLGPRIWMKDVHYWDGDRYITLFHPRNLRRAPAVARLYALVYAFRRRFLRLRRLAPQLCQKTLMERDPVLRQATTQPADAFVRQHGLEEITEVFCGPIFHSTLFLPYTEANAFYYLANLFPIWLPTYAVDVRPAVGRLSAGFEERIVLAKALEVEERPGGSFVVRTADARYGADNVVLALPSRNSRDLLPVQSTARDIPYCTIHIRGRRRREAAPGKTIFLSSDQPVRILWPQHNGVDIAFTDRVDPDLTPFYEQHEITDAVRWKTAVQLSDGRWRPLQPRPNLFTIGDHNVCGLEDSYLTGLFAANRIAR